MKSRPRVSKRHSRLYYTIEGFEVVLFGLAGSKQVTLFIYFECVFPAEQVSERVGGL
jgi:hypothetical protein